MSTTPYDDVFRTMCTDLPQLMIPMNNEGFGENTRQDAKVTPLSEHVFATAKNGGQQKRIVDSIFLVGKKRYHWECESNPDNTILLRLWEYDSQLAIQDYEFDAIKSCLTVNFPKTALLYLRSSSSTPDSLKIIIKTHGGDVDYDIPIIKIKDYNLENIFEKRLYFLIPFYIFRFEADFGKMEAEEGTTLLQKLTDDIVKISELLTKHVKLGILSAYEKNAILSLAKKSFSKLTKQHNKIHREVNKTMGGEILEYEAKTILRQGKKIGLEEGQKIGLEEGQKIGLEKGQKQTQVSNIKRMLNMGLEKAKISQLLAVPEEMVDKVAAGDENI